MRFLKQLPVALHPLGRNRFAVLKHPGLLAAFSVGNRHGLSSFIRRISDPIFGAEAGALHPMQADLCLPPDYVFVDAVKQLLSFVVKKLKGLSVGHLFAKDHEARAEEVIRALVARIEIASAGPVDAEVGSDGLVGEGGTWGI